MCKIKKNDNVRITIGKDRDESGRVSHVGAAKNRVIVEGRSTAQKHQKPGSQNQNGGIVSKEDSTHISNVTLLMNGERTKVDFELRDGRRIHVAKEGGKVID